MEKASNGKKILTEESEAQAKYLEDIESFRESVSKIREKHSTDQLSDFEKDKEQILLQYDELIKSSKQFGAEGKKVAAELEKEKWEAVSVAANKWLEKYQKEILLSGKPYFLWFPLVASLIL